MAGSVPWRIRYGEENQKAAVPHNLYNLSVSVIKKRQGRAAEKKAT